MPEKQLQARDVKLIQYLNEAYGKEKQLETALEAHIQMTTRPPYKKRLQQHLRETKDHARQVSRRIKALGGTPETVDLPGPDAVTGAAQRVQAAAGRAAALAQGPLHVLRGTGEQEKLLKNAKTEFHEEAEEIANYTSIEALAELVGDRDTAKVAKAIRREEERMRDFLAKLIPQLTKAVAQEEIPASERRTGSRRGGTTRRRTTASGSRSRSTSRGRGKSTSRSGSSRSGGARSSSRSSSSRSSSSRSTGSRSAGSRSSSSRSGSSRSGGSRSSSSRSTGSRSTGSRSSGSRSSGGRSSSRSSRSS